ncbi:MAG: RdgB/HAM1 family non-canonical purine NTP pyrophosphatase [Phascolarctobacterium sp.]|nr:RdgB/HAM1 family non-canonical purine NTP pyrophosphatase [Phascolarctobacterium sp.]
MIKELVAATNNLGKLEEFIVLMKDLPIEIKSLADFGRIEEPEETGRTFADNARLKAIYYARKTGMTCIADDSGLEVQALDGEPGVRSARYAGKGATAKENNDLLLRNMKFQIKRNCRFRCALAVAQPDGKILHEVDGICEGMLLHDPLGSEGFGYDPLFWSTELHKSMGEATMQEKNKVSHRGKAIRKLIAVWGRKNENRSHW